MGRCLIESATFAWLNWSRRLSSKDCELRHISVETMIYIVFAHQLLRRITCFLDKFQERGEILSPPSDC